MDGLIANKLNNIKISIRKSETTIKMEQTIFLTLHSHRLIAFYVGNGEFKVLLLDLGWRMRYP